MNPGCSELTRTPRRAQCSAAFLVIRRTAPLAAWYENWAPNPPTVPKIDATLTTEPPPERSMAAPPCFMPSQTPVWVTASTWSQVSLVSVSTVPIAAIPALLTSTASPPNAAVALVTTSRQADSSETSRARPRAPPPTSSASFSQRSASRSVTTTAAPSAASRRTTASPMPPVAPVTSAALPASLASIATTPASVVSP